MDVQALFTPAMPLASLIDGMVQIVGVAILAALCGGGIATGIMVRRLNPVLKKVESVAEREEARIRRAPALDGGEHRPIERERPRSEQALRHVYEVMRDLHDLTQNLDEQSQALHTLAHRLLKESTPGALSRSVVQDAADSAEGLARSADKAHRTYKRLSSSLGQLIPPVINRLSLRRASPILKMAITASAPFHLRMTQPVGPQICATGGERASRMSVAEIHACVAINERQKRDRGGRLTVL